jgi:hypothetical protein
VALPPQPAAVQPAAAALLQPAVQPSPRRIDWLQSAIAYILLIGIIVSGVLLTGGPSGSLRTATSSDGAFSVNVPQGWIQGEASPSDSGKEVLALARIEETNGVQSHFFVGVFAEFAPLSELEEGWQAFIESGKSPVAGQFGSVTRTTVAGTQALTVDFQGSKYGGQLLFVDYGRKTYIIQMSSDPSEFSGLRESDFAAILSSWGWR